MCSSCRAVTAAAGVSSGPKLGVGRKEEVAMMNYLAVVAEFSVININYKDIMPVTWLSCFIG